MMMRYYSHHAAAGGVLLVLFFRGKLGKQSAVVGADHVLLAWCRVGV